MASTDGAQNQVPKIKNDSFSELWKAVVTEKEIFGLNLGVALM
jgi:hypothetical protein